MRSRLSYLLFLLAFSIPLMLQIQPIPQPCHSTRSDSRWRSGEGVRNYQCFHARSDDRREAGAGSRPRRRATSSRHARFAKGVNKAGIEEEKHETDS
jgi:hypothetical protein